jgi:hypothetical protein
MLTTYFLAELDIIMHQIIVRLKSFSVDKCYMSYTAGGV